MKEVDNSIPSFMLLSQSSQSSPNIEVESAVHGNVIDMNEPLNDDEKLIWQYLLTVMDDKRWGESNKESDKKNDDEEIDVQEELKEVKWTFKAFWINTLEEGKWISQNIIDCWAALLNYMEKKERPSGKRRLWCYTTTIVSVS
ncbi:hypothetical protein Hanom_Chr14g01255871 [Helianthus anomalus]